MANAKRLPSGSWRVNVYVGKENGKRKYKSFTAATKKEAEFLASSYMMNGSNSQSCKLTLKEAAVRYIDSKENVLSPSTVREYIRTIETDFPLIFDCDIKLDKITQEMIQKGINQYALDHKPKSVRNIHGLLSAVLSVYLPSFKLNTTLPQKRKSEIYVPSEEEIKTLLDYVAGTEIEKAIMLAAFGSLRRSEISPLTAEDIKSNFITINKAMVLNKNREWITKQPKTFSGYRTIELPQFVVDRISVSSGRLVEMNPEMITHHFENVLAKCSVHHFRFHDLRHFQASILHAMGIPDKYIIARGGWKTESTLKNIYQHTMDKKRAEVENKICDYFESKHNPQNDNLTAMQHEIQHNN
ncbi:MAG: site-specific integrase [Lachnospiraceae bacterium]|nr:site-specific integrase [Ruminococcus sp.]MCM1276602.1 site-specific integrase [Lachnospiraceae bacterium]